MQSRIRSIFMKEPSVKTNNKVYYVNRNDGVEGTIDDANMLRIRRVDWYISGDIPEGNCSLNFADVFVSFSLSLECVVHCAHSPERYIKICQDLRLRNLHGEVILVRNFNSHKRIYIDHPLVEAAKPSGSVSYLMGTSDVGNKIFIKRVPVGVDCSKIIKVYTHCAHIANVVSLRSFEKDDQFVYLAFEETAGSLAGYIGKRLSTTSKVFPISRPLVVLRNVVHALMQLHKNGIIHGAVAPQHVLIRRGLGNDDMIKLCGMSKSIGIHQSKKDSITTLAYKAQNFQLARTILNVLADHKFDGTLGGEEFIGDDLKKVGNLAADLCEKLMDPNSSISLLDVHNHILFWDENTKINFIGNVSNALISKKLKDVEYLAPYVFGVEGWKSMVDSCWLSQMEKDSKHDRSLKADAYDENSLFDLVRLFRNSINHPKRIYPAKTSIMLERYISTTFSNLMTLLYNHMLDCLMDSMLYEKYHKKEV
nr:serine/threonine-protein kinase/endoribonuclease IRE1a-like [Tanacetum cinerariifolium]